MENKNTISELTKDIPLETRVRVANEIAFINLLSELKYREDKRWSEAEKETLTKLMNLASQHADNIMEEIVDWQLDGMLDTITDTEWLDVKKEPPMKDCPYFVCGLNSEGKIRTLRAKYIPEYYMESDGDDFHGDLDYNEEKDEFYWPEGWYEWNEYEDTHWQIDFEPLYYMPLPSPPSELINRGK